jgi:hypothetical protein
MPAGDPLHGLPSGQTVDITAVEFIARRRARVNGTLTGADDILTVEVEQAYGNCLDDRCVRERLRRALFSPAAVGRARR